MCNFRKHCFPVNYRNIVVGIKYEKLVILSALQMWYVPKSLCFTKSLVISFFNQGWFPVDVVYYRPMWVKKYSVLYLSSQTSSTVPSLILLAFRHPFSFGPPNLAPSFLCSFPLTSMCLLFFLCRFCSIHLILKPSQPDELHKRAEKRKAWLWPDVRIISCIIQIIR